jgi:hypothetical protein
MAKRSRSVRPSYVTEFSITAPSSLEGRLLSVSSDEPLPVNHLFRKNGARLRLSIASLESGRGTSLVPAEGITRIIYQIKTRDVKAIAEEPDRAPGRTSGMVTPLEATKPPHAETPKAAEFLREGSHTFAPLVFLRLISGAVTDANRRI